MVQPFFITGLPQSRTTWLANLFTTGNVFCHHDLLGLVESTAALCAQLRDGMKTGRVGDSDSGLLAYYSIVKREFPDAPWVLITRDFDEAWHSLCQFVSEGPWKEAVSCTWELRQEMLARWERARLEIIQWTRCMEVPYESLERTDTLERIWKHCVPGVKWDARRAQMLQTLSVRPFQEKSPMKPKLSLIRELYPQV